MPVSDDDKQRILDALSRIESETAVIKQEQHEQNSRLDSIEKTLKGDPEEPEEPGMRQKVNEMYQILRDYRALRKFFVGGFILVGTIAGSAIWDRLTAFFGGGAP